MKTADCQPRSHPAYTVAPRSPPPGKMDGRTFSCPACIPSPPSPRRRHILRPACSSRLSSLPVQTSSRTPDTRPIRSPVLRCRSGSASRTSPVPSAAPRIRTGSCRSRRASSFPLRVSTSRSPCSSSVCCERWRMPCAARPSADPTGSPELSPCRVLSRRSAVRGLRRSRSSRFRSDPGTQTP